jgi:uncharacterized membrane protein YraQ (UPF0718 family)
MIFLEALWNTILLSAPYLILGLLISGVIKQFIPMDKVRKWLGGSNFSSVIKAAFVGVPLPLCSCSVIPTAVTLRKSGASKASTSAFLIATPESGVDSIAMTYALMDLPMTIIRPIAAFMSAFFAGMMQILFNKEAPAEQAGEEEVKSCCSKNKKLEERVSFPQAVKNSIRFGFGDLIDDIALWFGFGLVFSALIMVFIPENFFMNLGVEGSRLLILLVGIPVYICASATTPIAAALVMKGVSPGAALLLLLVGPATNVSNILVLQKFIGRKAVFLNIFSVVLVGLFFSYLTDYFYVDAAGLDWVVNQLGHDHHGFSWWEKIFGVFLMILIVKGIWKENLSKYFKKSVKSCHSNNSVPEEKSCH